MQKSTGLVAENLEAAHEALLEDLRKLEGAARSESGENMAELSDRLRATFAHVTDHFIFEEENGYMEEVRKREPHLEGTIQQLGLEHRLLTHSLNAIIEEAETAASLDDALREKVLAWIERTRHHEVRENALVQDTFNLDLVGEV